MARLNVNPTRMELTKLKDRLKVATRGHKLLKDKSDEMIRQFMVFIRQNKAIRQEIEDSLRHATREFMLARSVTTTQNIEEAVAMPAVNVTLSSRTKNVMGVEVPFIEIENKNVDIRIPYGLLSTSAELDKSVLTMSALLPKMIELAEIEKTCNMLAHEIEKNRRRVNALEYVMIPQLEETIKYIKMKLDENERGTLSRLMKVKEMLAK